MWSKISDTTHAILCWCAACSRCVMGFESLRHYTVIVRYKHLLDWKRPCSQVLVFCTHVFIFICGRSYTIKFSVWQCLNGCEDSRAVCELKNGGRTWVLPCQHPGFRCRHTHSCHPQRAHSCQGPAQTALTQSYTVWREDTETAQRVSRWTMLLLWWAQPSFATFCYWQSVPIRN